MRPARLLVSVLALPALALAQDSAAPDPVGTLLQDALPPGADLVVHAPSLPRLLESAPAAGFGTAEAWRDAFRKHLAKWGGDEAERLTRGAESLLRLADGEALAAAMELPRLGSPTAPRTRAWVVALRSRATEKELRAAVDDVVTGGLMRRFPDPPRNDQAMGRTVLALSGPFDGVWIRVEDRLVAISDHPLALGLFFRGLERVTKEGRPAEDVSSFVLRVRWGRADSPAKWEGSTVLQREGVSAGRPLAAPAGALAADGAVLACASDDAADVPLFPVRVPDDVTERAKALSARPLSVRLLADGTFDVAGAGAGAADAKPLLAAAPRGAWLRALAEGRLESPFPLDAAALAAPLAAIDAAKPDVAAPVAEWRPGSDAGEIRGPAWNGPVTFLALRTLRDISWRTAPDAPPPPAPSAPERPAERPVLRGLNAPGMPPPKPGPALPAPEDR